MNHKKLVRVGLIGYGYWGPNLLRNLVSHEDASVIGVVEANADARGRCSRQYPHLPLFASVEEFLVKGDVDAVVIATPPSSHCDIAVKCLNAGAHVLVEKPMAMSTEECDRMIETARAKKRQIMVDHTFAFHPAVEYLAESIGRGELGDLLYYDSVRVNLGGFQPKTNVLWDLAPHDLSILDLFLKGETPVEVSTVGVRHFGASVEDLCYLSLKYANSFMAHICLNWIAPVKIRTITLGGSKKMAIYDDNASTEKVKIYDRSVNLKFQSEHDFRVNYRVGDMIAPAIAQSEALRGVIAHFLDCVANDTAPVCDGAAGRRVVQVLEAASLSMVDGGRPVSLSAGPIERRQPTPKKAAA